jgi:ubiquinone/menaquinone biosynthesis C-methylase UbiE
MPSFAELSIEEQARQLRDPAGEAGLATADALAAINGASYDLLIDRVALAAGDRVLEVGCGVGTLAPRIVGAGNGITYAGLDLSETMITAARKRNADLIADGRARFDLATTDAMPLPDGHFSKVLSAGVIHFWTDPARSLAEVRRVMRSGGTMAMGCLALGIVPPFAKPELGFHLRTAAEWQQLAATAGFAHPAVETLGAAGGPQMLLLVGAS